MKIKAKIFLFIAVSLLVGTVGAVILVAQISMTYIEKEETANIEKDLDSATTILNGEFRNMERTQLDWGHWNDTYDFIQGKQPSYRTDNLGDKTLNQLNVSGMVFLKLDYTIANVSKIDTPETNLVLRTILESNAKKRFLHTVSANRFRSGVTYINHQLYLVSAIGVTSSDGSKPINGYLIMIKKLDGEFYSYLKKVLGANIVFGARNTMLASSTKSFHLMNVTREGVKIQLDATIRDVLFNQVITMHTKGDRQTYIETLTTMRTLTLAIVIIFSVVIAASILGIHLLITRRIVGLNQFVEKIIKEGGAKETYVKKGTDEIASLNTSIHTMLDTLDENYIELRKNEERLHNLMEAIHDGYFDYDVIYGEIKVSEGWIRHLGHDNISPEMVYDVAFEYIHEEEREAFRQHLRDYFHGQEQDFYEEVRMRKSDGGYVWTLVRGRKMNLDEEGNPLRWIGSISDITRSKTAELENIYLLQTDTVTGLKNRAYLESVMEGIEPEERVNYCVLMADVNGLKLINDAFGHKEGDRLLNIVGQILIYCCSPTDIPVRWGGDEFLILIGNTRQYADQLIVKIRKEFDNIVSFPIKVNAAMGCSACRSEDISFDQGIKRAEEKMYRNKLFESRSIRNGVIASFEHTLNVTKIETYEHTSRVKHLALEVGKKLGLAPEELDELELLALLHDIGKIAIEDSILSIQGEPTKEQWAVIRTHPESGYRIANAMPEIRHIAEGILCHHEKFDGSGYPKGIAGEEIPLHSRIVAAVHRAEALLFGAEVFQEARVDHTIEELGKEAGNQFDPIIIQTVVEILNRNDMKEWILKEVDDGVK